VAKPSIALLEVFWYLNDHALKSLAVWDAFQLNHFANCRVAGKAKICDLVAAKAGLLD
jgi:hypothetical protein